MTTLKEILNTPDVTVVDVRTEEEYNMGHYPGAVLIPLHTIPYAIDEIKAMPKPIVFYCRSGNRSGQAVAYLRQNGLDNIYNGGGLEDMYYAKNN